MMEGIFFTPKNYPNRYQEWWFVAAPRLLAIFSSDFVKAESSSVNMCPDEMGVSKKSWYPKMDGL